MAVIFGSARIDENGKASGGKAGDQKQTASTDWKGEVSLENGYIHKLGWVVLRPKNPEIAHKIAFAMLQACNNKNIGYDQNQRLGIITNGTASKVATECDCSSLVRQCVIEGAGVDAGNFTTANEVSKLMATGLFNEIKFTSLSALQEGDILVTKKKGHTIIVVESSNKAKPTQPSNTYPKYTGTDVFVSALAAVGEKDTSYSHRRKIAAANGIQNYAGTRSQNLSLLKMLKNGTLKKA